jgi:hypothetical protein
VEVKGLPKPLTLDLRVVSYGQPRDDRVLRSGSPAKGP